MSESVTVWITGDQCSMTNTALLAAAESQTKPRVLMIESIKRGGKIKYHKKKLILIYSVMRHFAEELRDAGWQVDYYKEHPDFESAVQDHLEKNKPTEVFFMEQSEFGANEKLKRLLPDRKVTITPHCNFISTAKEFEDLHKTKDSRVTMERFYRLMRKKTNLLMDGDNPTGGDWNFDKENRQPPGKDFKFEALRTFPPDEITQAVIKMVDENFPDHPGGSGDWIYAVTRADALKAAKDFFDKRLDEFGPHQDSMLHGEPFLNHSVLSPYVNTCLLHPLELCKEAERRYIGNAARLTSVEGFIRQLIGWREFVWRVYWRLMPEYKERNHLNDAKLKLPDFYTTGDTKMRCMRDAIETVLKHGYAHHIVRLMLLGNFAMIAGYDPQETDLWFEEMFVDGYDWVMVPNVIGMALHADGGYIGTKPYAASANYINKMSDFCKKCEYSQKESTGDNACPFNTLYWHFLLRNEETFSQNHRMALIMKGLAGKPESWKKEIADRAKYLRDPGSKI